MIIFRKEKLEAELAALRDEWRKQMESALRGVAEEAISRLSRESEAMEKQAGARVAGMGQALGEATTQAENKFSALREAFSQQEERSRHALVQLERAEQRINDQAAKLAHATAEVDLKLSELRQHLEVQNERLHESLHQLQAADQRLSDHISKLDLLAEAAGQNVESRASAVLEAMSGEMTRRAEDAMAVWGQQVKTIQDSMGDEINRFTTQLKAELNDRLIRTDETLKNIEAATAAAHESLRNTQERLSRVSEQALEAAAGRMQAFIQEMIGNSERQIEESGRAATAKWIAALEDKATDATYTAFGSLFKVSEWCEKKTQSRMQAEVEKGLNAASENVREKADASLREFSEKADAAAREIAKVIEEGRGLIRSTWETEGEQFASRIRTTINNDAQATVSRISEDMLNQANSIRDAVRAETEAQEHRVRQMIPQLGDEAARAYELRLDQISQSALQENISRFNVELSARLDTLVRTAEQDLRQTCNQVFTEVGDALRQRLVELTFPRAAAKAAGES